MVQFWIFLKNCLPRLRENALPALKYSKNLAIIFGNEHLKIFSKVVPLYFLHFSNQKLKMFKGYCLWQILTGQSNFRVFQGISGTSKNLIRVFQGFPGSLSNFRVFQGISGYFRDFANRWPPWYNNYEFAYNKYFSPIILRT